MKKVLTILRVSNYLHLFAFSVLAPLYVLFALRVTLGVFSAFASWGEYLIIAGLTTFIFKRYESRIRLKSYPLILSGAYLGIALSMVLFLFVTNAIELYFVQTIIGILSGIVFPVWKGLHDFYESQAKKPEQSWLLFDGGDRILIGIAALIGGVILSAGNFQMIFILIFGVHFLAAIISGLLFFILPNRY
jgi:MFS family permease